MPVRPPDRARAGGVLRVGGAMGAFFGLKLALGLVLIGTSTGSLSTAGFVAFSQLFLFFALLATVSAAGVQNGLARQIAFAGGDAGGERHAVAAACRIWLVASLVALAATAALRRPLSDLLVGDASLAGVLPLVTLAAAAGGFGVLACAVLNGLRRAPTSLLLQAAGLVVGGLLCIWRLLAGDATGAVLGYAAGPIATSALAAIALRRAGVSLRGGGEEGGGKRRGAEVRLLLGYSLVFLAIAVIMPATLFGLRHLYREAFGTGPLGYWLAANRVSDVTSQLLGLYMAQIFLPQVTHEADPERARRLIARTLLIGSAVMLGGWGVFVAGSRFFVSTFLSAAFLPAIPFIGGYLLGDGLRVATSLTSHLMLARGRLAASVGVEAATAALLAAYLAGLTALGRTEAPYWAYPAAYATMALVLVPLLVWPGRLRRSSR